MKPAQLEALRWVEGNTQPEEDVTLPGCEAVRETEVTTPVFDAPFALRAEVKRAPRGRQEGLFSDE